MADGFIVRRGGVEAGEPIPAPTITLVSKTDSSITFTLTNNSVQERDVTFGLTTPPTTTTITLASQTTSGNQTFTGLDADTEVTIFAQAADGIIAELSVTTDPPRVFTAATGGTTLEYDASGKRFRSHTFNSSGTFTVTTVGDATDDRNKVDYLVIAGGGGAGNNRSGGGGAGGYRTTLGTSGRNSSAESKVTISASSFTVTVGLGGNASSDSTVRGSNGANSSISFPTSVQSLGGGGGGSFNNSIGLSGGSGGGNSSSTTAAAGTGTTAQGFNGGTGNDGGLFNWAAGGGGGAGGNGQNPVSLTGGNGGAGLSNTLRTGSAESRGGGGSGSGADAFGTATAGGGIASNGTANTGGGGSGNDGNGGSGIVIIRYEIAPSV